jgi:peroxiredoxin Q/BCP
MLLVSLTLSLLGIAPGDVAPNFTAPNQDGQNRSLSDYRGKPVLLFFYPKDETPGCTKEVCNLRNVFADFQKRGAVVLGLSRQDAKSHKEFVTKQHLPFDLLVDADGKVAEAFGVDRMPIIGLLKRQSVLVGPDGKIFRIYRDVDPEQHANEVLKDLDELSSHLSASAPGRDAGR